MGELPLALIWMRCCPDWTRQWQKHWVSAGKGVWVLAAWVTAEYSRSRANGLTPGSGAAWGKLANRVAG
jgi:hypothetical protein